jgi:hypothetical protein
VDLGEACAVLGVEPGAPAPELRAAYRRALLDAHPDVRGGTGDETRRVVAAYELLRDAPPVPPATRSGPAPLVTVDGDTVAADLPAGDLFAMLLNVGDRIGDVGYVDRENDLLEMLVTIEGYGACSVVLTLQGRATGVTEASCTVEPLAGGPPPPAALVAELLASGLRSLAT